METNQRAKAIELALQSDEGLLALAHAHLVENESKQISRPVYILQQPKESSKAIKAQWIQDLKWFTRVRTLDGEGQAVAGLKAILKNYLVTFLLGLKLIREVGLPIS